MKKLWAPSAPPEEFMHDAALKNLAELARQIDAEMVQATFSQLRSLSNATNVPNAEQLMERILTCLAIIASGQNPDGTAFTIGGVPVTANVLAASTSVSATQAATTFLTIPAGRTWSGWITLTVACAEAAAGAVQAQATGIISATGVSAPAPVGNLLRCSAYAGANAASGLVGDGAANSIALPLIEIASAAQAAVLQLASTITGTVGEVNASAIGYLVA